MQALESLTEQARDPNHRRKRRCDSSSKEPERSYKFQRIQNPQRGSAHSLAGETGPRTQHTELLEQLPPPTLTEPDGNHVRRTCAGAYYSADEVTRTSLEPPVTSHRAESKCESESDSVGKSPRRRPRNRSPSGGAPSIDQWLSKIPQPEDIESMSQPPSRRSRSSSSHGRSSQRGDGTESTVSRDAYEDVNYAVVLETKNSFMRASKSGITDDDRELCRRLLSTKQTLPKDTMFDDQHFQEFCSLLEGRSEANIYLDLHPLLVPSAEILSIKGLEGLENLIQGYKDPWVKAIPIYGPCPQPDHTVGFRWSTFTDEQRRKLGIDPVNKSYFTAREDIYFPFLTSEVKCAKQALETANRQNAHSMTIAVRAVVELFRTAGRATEVHRKVLGFSISHDDKIVRIYGHYPEIDGENTAYYRYTIKEFHFGSDEGKEKWATYTFTCNVYKVFVPSHLDRIKKALDQLPDPLMQSLDDTMSLVEQYDLSSQENTASGPDVPQLKEFRKSGATRGLNAELGQ